MPRPLREIVPGGIYHVTTRGNNKQDIFLEEKDYEKYLALLRKAKDTYGFKLYLYVLMTNHVHLLIRTSMDEEKSIALIMQSLNSTHTKYFNLKYQRVGHLFQGRYFGELIKSDSHLLELTRYIHLNPVRANFVSKPQDYLYSSYLIYAGLKDDKIIDCDEILAFFSKRPDLQRKRYIQFVENGLSLSQLRVSLGA